MTKVAQSHAEQQLAQGPHQLLVRRNPSAPDSRWEFVAHGARWVGGESAGMAKMLLEGGHHVLYLPL